MAIDASGNAYVGGTPFTHLDPQGRAVPFVETFSGFDPALDSNGGIYLVDNYALVKRDANGALASGFGSGGKSALVVLQTPYPASEYAPYFERLLVDADGSSYVIGISDAPHYSGGFVLIYKRDPTGQPPVDFGQQGGKATAVRTDPLLRTPVAVARDTRGNFLIAGAIRPPLSFTPAVTKLDTKGDVVNEFGGGGTWVPPACVTNLRAVATDASDNVYVGGTCSGRAVVFKLDSRGTPVTAFGDGGMATSLYGDVGSAVYSILVASNGSVYTVGVVQAESACGVIAVGKIGMTGVVDASFGSGGSERIGVLGDDGVGAAIGSDAVGRIYVGTNSVKACPITNSSERQFVVARLGG
jgi:hypothetical protein